MAYISAAGEVSSAFDQASVYANEAKVALTGFTDALNASIYAPPTVSAAWSTITVPEVTPIGDLPTLPDIEFGIPGVAPLPISETLPEISIPEFSELPPDLTYPTAPVISYPTAPTVPSISVVTLPDAPTLDAVDLPTYLALSTVSFGGLDLHTDWLTQLENIPALTLVEPSSYSYARGPEYASALLDTLKAQLVDRLAGGTGLDTAVEQAIWDRARSRETTLAQAGQDEIMRASEALGFQLPAGVLAAQLREAQQTYYDKLSTLSRDVAIKQAELEQENLKQTIAQGMELEAKLIDYSYKLEQITFETAKAYADNAIQIYNAGVEGYKALMLGYQTYSGVYKTVIDAEMAKIEVYKAELSGEQTKAQINNSLVQQYKAQIDAAMSTVEIYKAQISGAQALVQLEQAKIGAAGEQIRAYTSQVNAETAKIEAYKASVQGEGLKVENYKAQAQAYGQLVGAQAEVARANSARFTALSSVKSAEWDGYKALISGEVARVQALGVQSGNLLDGFKAGAAASESMSNMAGKRWEAELKQYEAGQNYVLQAAKINGDFTSATNNIRLDAAKVGAQVYAQLAASAYGMINASAGISASENSSNSISYSFEAADLADMPGYGGISQSY